MRWAAGSVSLGLGFGLPCVFGIRHFAQTRQVWTFMGFPTYGDGPFERIGIQTSTALLVGFLSVCVAEVALAVMLWAGAPYAAAVGYMLLVFEVPSGSGSPCRSDRCWGRPGLVCCCWPDHHSSRTGWPRSRAE